MSRRWKRLNQVAPVHIWSLQVALTFLFMSLPTDAQAQSAPARRPSAGAAQPTMPSAQAGARTPSETKPAIVAVVNGQPIARQHLAKQCLERYGEQVLESLVNKRLILDACQRNNISITEQDIEDEIDRIAARFSLPKDRWLQMLQEERNISSEQYRRDIIWPTLALKVLAANQLQVTQEDLEREFESEYGPKVQVRMIAAATEMEAQQILKEANANPDQFGLLAKKYSKDPNSAAARGLIPPIRRHVGSPEVEKACFALQPGEISPIVNVAGQWLIFQCEKHLPAAHISPQYRKAANDRLRERLTDQKLRTASSEIFEELQKSVTVVNVLNDPQKRKENPNVAATINGAPIPLSQLGEECIARHGVNVLESEINYVLLKQALDAGQVKISRQEIDAEIARAAESYGYLTQEKTPDIATWLKEVTEREGLTVDAYIRDAVWPSVALKKLVKDRVEITDQDLKKGFEANYGPRIEVLAIVLSNQRTAQEVWDMARSNLTPEYFGELASRYSIEPISRANMGEVPPIRRFSGQPEVEKEAFSLKQDDPLSAIVGVADRYIIMYYLGQTDPVVSNPADVRDELERDIREKKMRLAMAEEFERLKGVAQIDNFLAGKTQSGGATPPQLAPPTRPADVPPAAGNPQATKPQLIRPASQRRRVQ